MKSLPITNAMTIDVEDYFQVSAFASHISRVDWNVRECRVEQNIDVIIEILASHKTSATFFTLGWIAERFPHVIRRIISAGHEIASHGYGHERATDQTEKVFFADINLAKLILEDLTGTPVLGYRAPSFSIGENNLWAFDCIAQAGYRYSSSIYPIRHDHYGMPESPRFPYQVKPSLMEIPITTLRLLNRNVPSSGGGYFRLLPYTVSNWMLKRVNQHDGQPGVFYFHPWEIDTGQPRVEGLSRKTHFRHYVNIVRMEQRLNQLLSDFNWNRMDQIFLPHSKLKCCSDLN